MTSVALDDQRFKDHCLIIVGNGGKADEILSKRRLEAGGRLAHFLTDGPDDSRVVLRGGDDGAQYDFFTWQPPKANMRISRFAQQLGAKRRTFWTKIGPDGVELGQEHHLTIGLGVTGKPRHVTLTDEDGNIIVEMSGEVVVDPDVKTAESLPVEVKNTELKAFGVFSWRFALPSMLFHLLWQIAKISLSIQFEQSAESGKVPWFRNLLAALNWCLTQQPICVEMVSMALTGTPPTLSTHVVGNLASTIAIMAVSPFALSEFALCLTGISAMIATIPWYYFQTIGVDDRRRFFSHFLWATAQSVGTTGCYALYGGIAQAYAFLVSSGQSLVATFFLPFATAFAEIGLVVFIRIMYDKFVHRKKTSPEESLVGDQIFIPAPCVIMAAHAYAEGCRLTATFSGAITSGGWSWIPTSILGIALNLAARLGWSRFLLIQLGKKMWGGPKAMSLFAPTGWSKYHDELKIYAGYFRFASVLALVAARAAAYGFGDGDGQSPHPAFNQSALFVIICGFCGEIIEDEIVTKELLPVNPAGPGLLKMNGDGDNADPAQLITLEHLPNVQEGDTWRLSELGSGGTLSKRTTSGFLGSGEEAADMKPEESIKKVVSLGTMETDVWSRLRKWFGQPRQVNPSPSLHGLRELPFAVQFAFVGIVCEFTLGLLGLLVGHGYMRGTCDSPLEGDDRILGLIYWGVPLPC